MIIDQQILEWLTAQAKASPRLGMDLDLRYSPTGRKASIEDIVVDPVDLHLTSRTQQIAANEMYRMLGN